MLWLHSCAKGQEKERQKEQALEKGSYTEHLYVFSSMTNNINDQDKKKHKDHGDQPMQYSKFLKGVYDSSDEDEVTTLSFSLKLCF